MFRLWGFSLACVFVLAVVNGYAADDKKDAAKSDPPGAVVEAKLVAKKATYKLDLGGKSAEEFKKALEQAATTHEYPNPPEVDLVLELVNTSDKEAQVKIGGTSNVVTLDLKGPGAVSVPVKGRITNKLVIAPKTITLAAGKSASVPITTLAYGFKNSTDQAYWTKAGDYTLAASYKTWISPGPKDAKTDADGFTAVTLTSAPAKITVEEKK
jgi:hypothetical protein